MKSDTKRAPAPFRTGFGYDVHRFVLGRPLWLGGICIPHSMGLDGHSDADVLLHAITDALLGALALRDIGYHFPDTSDEYRGADSAVLLQKALELVHDRGYVVGNVDATIVAERPKVNPHVPDIQRRVAQLLQVNAEDISIKATTNEKMGFAGREEGMIAYATILVCRAELCSE